MEMFERRIRLIFLVGLYVNFIMEIIQILESDPPLLLSCCILLYIFSDLEATIAVDIGQLGAN